MFCILFVKNEIHHNVIVCNLEQIKTISSLVINSFEFFINYRTLNLHLREDRLKTHYSVHSIYD